MSPEIPSPRNEIWNSSFETKVEELIDSVLPEVKSYEASFRKKTNLDLQTKILKHIAQISKRIHTGNEEATNKYNSSLTSAKDLIMDLPIELMHTYSTALNNAIYSEYIPGGQGWGIAKAIACSA